MKSVASRLPDGVALSRIETDAKPFDVPRASAVSQFFLGSARWHRREFMTDLEIRGDGILEGPPKLWPSIQASQLTPAPAPAPAVGWLADPFYRRVLVTRGYARHNDVNTKET
jgi:hypothetical protein